MIAFFDAHQWAVPIVLYLAAAVLTALLRFSSSDAWDAFAVQHPRAATVIRVMRALLPYVPKAVEVLRDASAAKRKAEP